MKDPTRFLDLPQADDPARLLLQAAASEQPPEGAIERVLGQLGVAGGEVSVEPDAHLSGVRPASRAVRSAGGLSAKLAPRLWLLGAGAVSLVAAGWFALEAPQPGPPPSAAGRAAQPAANAAARAAAQPLLEPAKPLPPPAASARVQAASPAPRELSLAQEIASLDHIRTLLATDQPSHALRALERHARAFAHGALQPEASVLQIEALVRAGQAARARALAARFLAQHADSPHAQRVRSLMSEADARP